jgi:4-alpha-glucanotransferase
MSLDQRTSGVLLHVTSLPGPHGIGDFGPAAFHFVDWLAGAGQRLWQVLPLTPIGPGDSPYQSVSAFAGSPLMVALEPLVERGWLPAPDAEAAGFDPRRVDYGRVVPWRMARVREAAAGFFAAATPAERAAFETWCGNESGWLDDYALFMALEAVHTGAAWWQWPAPLARREPAALAAARRVQADEVAFWCFVQWCFDTQLAELKRHANARGVGIVGDLPIFVAHHSADCWARPELYHLDIDFQPTVVAGVPPDFFSATGQRWGNPLYHWERMADDGYRWWTARVRRMLAQADVFRIDHFRGFAAYWEIAADCPTAIDGRWVLGPGKALFDAIEAELGRLPIIAEDLGVITPDVEALRDGCGFPGMRILQFAFGGDGSHTYLPHNYGPGSVVYTGTHDNDTTLGWWRGAASETERRNASVYLGLPSGDDTGVTGAMVRAAATSVARTAIFPLQDVLGLDGSHRMNVPGQMGGNWGWRFEWSMVGEAGRALGELTAISGRAPLG